ncbi:uncharacterized protein OCT59_003426 [Rhizophagus irregularis]|uniref:uncharacterized protein n=1 Tax=Rhizophagus irregularis TaxID=588596 RepID=UPI003329EAE0|nr:hypothetical protein OCT59_003426 [Rhizophagus irregularis]
MDKFIFEKGLKWIPYCKFVNVKYFDKGGFGTVYKAKFVDNANQMVLKCSNNLNENLNEFLNEWDYHENPLKRPSALEVKNIIENWIFLPNRASIEDINEELKSNIMEFRRALFRNRNPFITRTHPQAHYTSRLLDFTSEKLNESLKSNCSYYRVNEISSEIESQDSQAYYASDFTSGKVYEMSRSEDLNDCVVEDMNH